MHAANKQTLKHTLLLVLATIAPFCGFSQRASNQIKFYKHIIYTLSADDMNGRMAGTVDEKSAANFIKNTFAELKLPAHINDFEYKIRDTGNTREGANIYCYVNNHSDSTILIGAHYDHIGRGGIYSRSFGKNAVHPGADDNASGVALLFGLVARQNKWTNKKYNYLFTTFAAHEVGLYGSAAFSDFCKKTLKPICLVLNFDMVGRLDTRERALTVYSYRANIKSSCKTLHIAFNGKIMDDEPDKVFETDCRSFANSGIKCLSFTTGIHNDYHKITDDAASINYSGIWDIQAFIESLLNATTNSN